MIRTVHAMSSTLYAPPSLTRRDRANRAHFLPLLPRHIKRGPSHPCFLIFLDCLWKRQCVALRGRSWYVVAWGALTRTVRSVRVEFTQCLGIVHKHGTTSSACQNFQHFKILSTHSRTLHTLLTYNWHDQVRANARSKIVQVSALL